jgi:hydroxymethylglutaryl-CoA lyase
MQDTAAVLGQLDLSQTKSKLLLLPIPEDKWLQHAEIQYLGYPFSISENFQMRNTTIGVLSYLDEFRNC